MSSAITSERVGLTVDGADVDLHYRTGGQGPPLVFLHGIGLDAATVSWRHALPALAEERTVYAPDLPGHGESDKPDRAYTTQYYLETVEAFLDAVGVTDPAVAGLSMGGALALGHALDGGSVERLVLVNSYGLGGDAYWRTAASGILQTPLLGNMLWQGVPERLPDQLRGPAERTRGPDAVDPRRRGPAPAAVVVTARGGETGREQTRDGEKLRSLPATGASRLVQQCGAVVLCAGVTRRRGDSASYGQL